jgi:hypothetical protein
MEPKRRLALLPLLIITFMLALAARIAPAQAQTCQERCTEWDADGACIGHIFDCPTGVAPFSSPKPTTHFGAIAYGPKSGAYGYSFSWDTQAQAESTAMKNCAQNGNDCEVAVWFGQQCGAVVSDVGTNYYWGLGKTSALAVADAKKTCAKQGGRICQTKVSQCSQ